jgi:DnaJ-class molecular chaperone
MVRSIGEQCHECDGRGWVAQPAPIVVDITGLTPIISTVHCPRCNGSGQEAS